MSLPVELQEALKIAGERAVEIDRLTAALERIRRRAQGSVWSIANGALLSLPDRVTTSGEVKRG